MADRRRGPNDGDARAFQAVARAVAFRAADSAQARAFLRGLQLAENACRDQVDTFYAEADRHSDGARESFLARAAAAKACAERIGALFDQAARAAGIRPSRAGLKWLLTQLEGGIDA